MSNALRRGEAAWTGLPERYRWRQAGLYMDLTGLGRPLPSRQLSPPRGVVEAVDGRLVELRGIGAVGELVDAPADLLERFVALRKADDARLAAFAQRYGFFYFCEHGNPGGVHIDELGKTGVSLCAYGSAWHEQSAHTQALLNEGASATDVAASYGEDGIVTVPEPAMIGAGESCGEWRSLASEAWSCLEVAAALHVSRLPQPEHLQALLPDGGEGLGAARVALEQTIRSWLQHAMVQLAYRWRPTWVEPRLEIGSAAGSRLFGELAMQLAFTTARAGGFVVCAECGDPFTPARRPKLGQRAFCPTCRADGAPQRAAARDWARRRKESGRG